MVKFLGGGRGEGGGPGGEGGPHAPTHGVGGSDPLTPAAIGAVELMADGFPPVMRELEPVKWMWINTGQNGVDIGTGLSTVNTDWYNLSTKTITAASNTALPTPTSTRFTGSGAFSGAFPLLDGSMIVGAPSSVAAGMQVGDRIYYGDQYWWGASGVYVVVDVGQNGVRPYVLTLAEDLQTAESRAENYIVKLAIDQTGGDLPTNCLVVERLIHFPGSIGYPLDFDEYKVYRIGSFVACMTGHALGLYDSALGVFAYAQAFASIAIGYDAKSKDTGLVAISSAQGGAYVRKLVEAKSGNFTFARRDEGRRMRCTSASAQTATIPTSATADTWEVGAELELIQAGSGIVTIGGVGGVTVTGDRSTSGPGSRLIAIHTSLNNWFVTCIPGSTGTLARSNPAGITGAAAIANMVSLTQAQYNAAAKNASTLYYVTD